MASKPAIQRPSSRCDCGARTVIEATASPWIFHEACTRCAYRGVIAWATVQPAPQWTPAEQLLLVAQP